MLANVRGSQRRIPPGLLYRNNLSSWHHVVRGRDAMSFAVFSPQTFLLLWTAAILLNKASTSEILRGLIFLEEATPTQKITITAHLLPPHFLGIRLGLV